MSIDSLPNAMPAIGATLHEARMRAHIDVTDVEHATKIRARYLLALENEEWEDLPGSVYVKSFLRTYADYLGLDSRALVDEYKRRYEPAVEPEQRPAAARRRETAGPRPRPRVPGWVVIAVVLVVVLAVLIVLGLHRTTKPAPPVRRPVAHHPRHVPRPRPRPVVTSVRVSLVPTGRVYVCMEDGAGRPLIPGQIFDVGQTVPVQRAATIKMTLGNNLVHLAVNGRTVPIAPATGPIGLEFTPTGTHTLPPSQQPTCT